MEHGSCYPPTRRRAATRKPRCRPPSRTAAAGKRLHVRRGSRPRMVCRLTWQVRASWALMARSDHAAPAPPAAHPTAGDAPARQRASRLASNGASMPCALARRRLSSRNPGLPPLAPPQAALARPPASNRRRHVPVATPGRACSPPPTHPNTPARNRPVSPATSLPTPPKS
eukprot:354622-Chlamydomonas_euryale.AAC.10